MILILPLRHRWQYNLMKISMIAALDQNNAIGLNGQMPWHLPDDFKYFKAITMGKPMLMGRKTFEAIGRILPGRPHWIISTQDNYQVEGALTFTSVEQAFSFAKENKTPELMIIGGGQIYAQCLPLAHYLYLTRLDTVLEQADTHFPTLNPNQWREIERTRHDADEKHPCVFYFTKWERI